MEARRLIPTYYLCDSKSDRLFPSFESEIHYFCNRADTNAYAFGITHSYSFTTRPYIGAILRIDNENWEWFVNEFGSDWDVLRQLTSGIEVQVSRINDPRVKLLTRMQADGGIIWDTSKVAGLQHPCISKY